jgi:deoxyribodipyrimidine photo-lyase
MRALVWFRSDLRSADNTALHEACRAAADGVVALFMPTPRQWRQHHWGPPKVDFVLRCVGALSTELERLGIPLLIRETATFSAAPRLLSALMRELDCDALFFNREYEVNEQARDEKVAATLRRRGLQVSTFHDQTVLPPDSLKTRAGEYYRVFTPFKNNWLTELHRSGLPRPRPRPRKRGSMPLRPDPVPQRAKGFKGPLDLDRLWPAGERAARRRLDRFIAERIERYADDRDFPDLNGTSTLSPWLACGAISPRQCLQSAADANLGEIDSGRKGVTTWISELAWREFYRHVLVGYPHVCRNRAFKRETDRLPWRTDDESFRRWCEGQTGVPIVDAAMRQLERTGWMHNRLRMIVAMYLAKDLFIDWRRGESHFMRSLVDGDFANNNGGWQWSASTGCDAAPYFRVFNPVRQSERWDPEGRFIRRYCPELAGLETKQVHDPSKLGADRLAELGYPQPMVNHRIAVEEVVTAFRRLGPVKR